MDPIVNTVTNNRDLQNAGNFLRKQVLLEKHRAVNFVFVLVNTESGQVSNNASHSECEVMPATLSHPHQLASFRESNMTRSSRQEIDVTNKKRRWLLPSNRPAAPSPWQHAQTALLCPARRVCGNSGFDPTGYHQSQTKYGRRTSPYGRIFKILHQ